MGLVSQRGRKHCEKGKKCWMPAFSHFQKVFSKGFFLRVNNTLGLSKISLSDLVFQPTYKIFKLVKDIIRTNILTKFQEYWTENVASTAYTRFF